MITISFSLLVYPSRASQYCECNLGQTVIRCYNRRNGSRSKACSKT